MAKKAYNNYDDTLFGQYIRQIENADSAGWNASDRIWRAPQRKGLDKRNRGMGVDVLNNLDTKALTKNRPGQYLTEKEEHQLRNAHIQYLLDVINRRKEEDNPALKNMSPKKQAQVLGIMYRGDAPELWKENTILGKALISDKDEDMDKAIKDFYESKGLGERAKNDSIFWNNQKMQNKPKAASVPQTHINNTVEYQDAIKTYKPAIIPSNTVRDTKKAMQDKVDFHNFMDSISIQNNLPPAYTPKSSIHSEGGYMYKPRDAWEALSMPEKAEMMKVAVKNGITNLQDIRDKYNEFAEGGNIYKEGGKKKSSNANSSAQRAMRYFMDKGLTDYQAAGLVGNLMRESGMNPQALNKGSKAYGLAQWLGPRKKALFARYGNNPTLENQLDFIWSELNSTHKNGLRHLRSSRSAEEAARNAMGYYEFSAGPEAAIANMRKYGQDGEGSMRKGISFASNLMGQPIPAYNTRQNEAVQLSLQESAVPSEGFIYTPLNPQVFGIADTPSYTINVPDQTLPSEPQAEESSVSLYSPKELDRQERMDRLSAFNNVLRMTSPQGNGNVFLDAIEMLTGNAFAEGGGIRIKPSKKGTFTAAASKHGMGVQEFASKVLANKENYSPAMVKKANFARNASKWHGLGGNLYEDGGSYSYTKPLDNVFVDSEGNLLDPSVPSARGTVQLPEVIVTTRDPRKPVPTAFDRHEEWLRPMMDFVPGVGDALQGKDAITDVVNGNYGKAAINAGALLLPNALEKPAKWILKGVSKRTGSQLGDALLRFIGESPEYRYGMGSPMSREGLSDAEKELLDVFERRGIDTSIFKPEDLQEMLRLRRDEVRMSLPKNARYNYVNTGQKGSFNIEDLSGFSTIGETRLYTKPDNNLAVDMVENFNPDYSGVSQRGYDSAIRLAQSRGGEGLITGERLLMPEVTTRVQAKYPDKIQIGNNGIWGPVEETATKNNPVFLLTTPTGIRRVKADIFDPIIINNRGDMNVLWDKKNLMWGYGGNLFDGASYK